MSLSFWGDAADIRPKSHDLVSDAIDITEAGRLVELPNGHEGLLFGDPEACKDYNHKQGQNEFGYQGTCGLTSSAEVLNEFGIPMTENDVVRYAVEHGLCEVTPGSPESSGGTTVADQAQILTDIGVPSHIETGHSLEELAAEIRDGHGVIIEVNAGELWGEPAYYDTGGPNHAITVTGVAVNPDTGMVEGVYINDSGTGDSGRFVPAEHAALQGWLSNGSLSVVTDLTHN